MSIETNKSDKILKISLIITLILLAGILIFAGVTYAYWQKEYESEKENLLSSGCFSFKLTDKDSINLVNAYPISEDDAMKQTPYNFTIENNCSIDMYYNITLNTTGSSNLDSSIRYKLIDNEENIIGTDIISNLSTYKEYNNYTYTDDGGEFNIINSYVLGSDSLKAAVMNDDNTQVVTAGESKTYDLYIWMDENVEDVNTMGKSFEAKVLVTSKIVNQDNFSNENIITAYAYNQDSTASNYCVSGNEETCVKTNCYKEMTAGSCNSGDILEYKVNDNNTVRFHVMYDNGKTLTMQSQENILKNISWIDAADYNDSIPNSSCTSNSCNDIGPITILNALESATNDWDNVNDQTYTMGTTVFKTNEYTGCIVNSCSRNSYTWTVKKSKVRMITLQEAIDFGCNGNSKSCPVWMLNYLYTSPNYGGTVSDPINEETQKYNYGYWTMNACSTKSSDAWAVRFNGDIYINGTWGENFGARAVIEINK